MLLASLLAACSSSSSDDVDNQEIIVGGDYYKNIIVVGEMTAPISEHKDLLLPDGRVLITGGQAGEGGVAYAQIYDPQTRKFSALPPMLEPRFVHAMNMLPNGDVLITGGFSASGGFLGSSEIFDGTHFVRGPDLLENRDNQRTYTMGDGRIFIEGGDNERAGYIASTEIYDPIQNRFVPGPILPVGRAMDTINGFAHGKIVMAGGIKIVGDQIHFLNEVIIYNPESNNLELGNYLHEARKQHRATTLLDGRILLSGGGNEEGDLRSTELYSATHVVRGPDMLFPRREHCSVLLPSGDVFIAGGYSNGEYVNSTEFFDPSANSFRRGPDMSVGRAYPTCTLLKNGDVLIAGGSGSRGALQSAELLVR